MSRVERPNRESAADDKHQLLALDRMEYPSDTPSRLPLTEIHVYEALFQQRGTSLVYRSESSRQHVEGMARAVRQGQLLDPIAIAAFGPRWVMLDGHHRRQAYLAAGHASPVPVAVHSSDLRGPARLVWAKVESATLNTKDKLPMSQDDKHDTAWRMTVEGGVTKAALVEAQLVSDGTVSTMRRVKAALRDSGRFSVTDLQQWSWKQARFEKLRLSEDDDDNLPSFDAQERKRRILIKKLTPALRVNCTASELLEALEELRPGIGMAFSAITADGAASLEI